MTNEKPTRQLDVQCSFATYSDGSIAIFKDGGSVTLNTDELQILALYWPIRPDQAIVLGQDVPDK